MICHNILLLFDSNIQNHLDLFYSFIRHKFYLKKQQIIYFWTSLAWTAFSKKRVHQKKEKTELEYQDP